MWRVHLALLSVQLLFGLWPVAGTAVMREMSPPALIGFRLALGAPLLVLVAGLPWRRLPSRRDLLSLAGLAALGISVNQLLFAEGLHRAGPINASITILLIPAVSLGVGTVLGLEKPSRARLTGIAIALLGAAILLGVEVLSLVGMLGFVVPQFEKLFKDMGDALPLPTRIVMSLGHGFKAHGLMLAIAALLIGWVGWRWLRSPAGRGWWQNRALRLPVVGALLYKYELTLFTRSLGTLLGNGVPLLTALHIATETVGNANLRGPLATMGPQVKEGTRMVRAMENTRVFEPLAVNLVRVGEETGRIGPMMLELSSVLDREVETGIKRALTLLEPVLILLLGVLIAAIIVSILLGILSINDLAG